MDEGKSKPPRLAQFLLRLFMKHGDRDYRIGDYEEYFYHIRQKKGKLRALIWYWIQVLGSLPKFINNSIYGSFLMYKNYIKIALRNIRKHKEDEL